MNQIITMFDAVVALSIIALLIIITFVVAHLDNVEMSEAYTAWVKNTGNTQELSYEEWRALMKVNKRQQRGTTILVPMNMGR